MSRLEKLIDSLITVIIFYHDHQSGVNKLGTVSNPTNDALKKIIDDCTKTKQDRNTLLLYVLNEIQYLREQRYNTTPYGEQEFKEYKKQVARLFCNLVLLLKTNKDTKCELISSKLNEKDAEIKIDCAGLLNPGYLTTTFCYSGSLIIEKVLEKQDLTQFCTEEKILEITNTLCVEHQNALLAPQVTELKTNLNSAQEEISRLKTIIDENDKVITELKAKIVEEPSTISSLKEEIRERSKVINELGKDRDRIKAELKEKSRVINDLTGSIDTLTKRVCDLEKEINNGSTRRSSCSSLRFLA